MEITTGIIDEHGVARVAIQIQENPDDPDCTTILISPDLAWKVAFGLMTEADHGDPPHLEQGMNQKSIVLTLAGLIAVLSAIGAHMLNASHIG